MAWIESHQDIREHPKTYSLMTELGIDKRGAIGLVHLLWWWTLDNAMEGEIRQPNGAVARAVEWDGDANVLVEGLIKAGWLDREKGSLYVHDWLHRAGPIVEKRLHRRRLKEKSAGRKRPPNGSRTATERPPNGAENRPTVSVSESVTAVKTLPAPRNGAVHLPEILKPETPLQILIRGWKIQSGVDPDDKAWDQAHFKRHLRPAQSLLNLFQGDVDAALDCIEIVYRELVEKKGLDLSLQGVVNNSGRFRQEWQERRTYAETGAR